MNASVTRWHIESAMISLKAAATLGSRDAAHALKVLQHPWPVGGRPPSNDAEALAAVLRIGGREAVGIVAKSIAGPAQREAAERRLRRKRKQAVKTD